jgi:hypothetical protein
MTSTTQATALYVYGVCRHGVAAEPATGIAGAAVREIADDDLAALVSDLPGEEPELGREEMTTHARVLEQALEHGTVLPMRFGVVMADEEAVRDGLLRAHGAELRRQLAELNGTVELRVRATSMEERLLREVLAENPELARLRAAPEAETHFAQLQLGELVAEAVAAKRGADADAILGALTPLALAADLGTPAHERVVLSASFLVAGDRLPEFDAALERLAEAESERIRLRCVGPLPPYSFVELEG